MLQNTRRRATLADAMLLIAGTAVSLSTWRGLLSMRLWRSLPDTLDGYYSHALAGVAFLVPLSLTLLIIALRQPRPRLRRMISEPSMVVGLSALFLLAINTLLVGVVMALAGSMQNFTDGKILYYCRMLAEQTGMAMGSAWFALAVGGRFRKPRGWMDLSGLALGLCWILLALFSMVFTHI